MFEEQPADVSNPLAPVFSYIVQVDGCVFGPSTGSNKNEAKAKVSVSACDCLGVKHSGFVKKGIEPIFTFSHEVLEKLKSDFIPIRQT